TPESRTFPASLLLSVSGSLRHTARTRSGAFYPHATPSQTSPAAAGSPPESGPLRLDLGIPARCRRHSALRSPCLGRISYATPAPRGQKRSADRYWLAAARSPPLAAYPSPFPTIGLPPSPRSS